MLSPRWDICIRTLPPSPPRGSGIIVEEVMERQGITGYKETVVSAHDKAVTHSSCDCVHKTCECKLKPDNNPSMERVVAAA